MALSLRPLFRPGILAFLLLSAIPAFAQRRAVMESLATTGTALFVSTTAVRVGVGTGSPATTLDVLGTSQFGTTAKSTFSTTGALTLAANTALTLSGASGNFVGASSVTASAFFGDGSNLTGVGSGASQSTVTYSLTGATTETTNFRLCYATGTLTFNGSAPVQVHYSGDITNSGAAGTYCIINFLKDGAFISPGSTTVGFGKSNNAAAGGSGNATTLLVLPNPGSGSHSYCISLISPSGTTCTFTNASAYTNQFGVTELR